MDTDYSIKLNIVHFLDNRFMAGDFFGTLALNYPFMALDDDPTAIYHWEPPEQALPRKDERVVGVMRDTGGIRVVMFEKTGLKAEIERLLSEVKEVDLLYEVDGLQTVHIKRTQRFVLCTDGLVREEGDNDIPTSVPPRVFQTYER